MPKNTRLVRLLLDFDGTLTTKDTLHVVAKAGYDRQKLQARSSAPTPWNEIVDAYLSDYTAHESTYRPLKYMRRTLSDEVRWLNSLQFVETASANRVYDAGVFSDVTKEDMSHAANEAVTSGEIQFRPGWTELISTVASINSRVATNANKQELIQIISVNWSRWFVWGAMRAAARQSKAEMNFDITENRNGLVAVYANEIPSILRQFQDRHDGSDGLGGEPVELRTSGDKLNRMLHEVEEDLDQGTQLLQTYVGDSVTDLECLVAANVGICVRDDPMGSGQRDLAETCDRLGISVKHISGRRDSAVDDVKPAAMKGDPALWWARDFKEINAWLSRFVELD